MRPQPQTPTPGRRRHSDASTNARPTAALGTPTPTTLAGRWCRPLLLLATVMLLLATNTSASSTTTPELPNQAYLQVAMLWGLEDGKGAEAESNTAAAAVRAAAAGPILDEVASSLCHLPRRQVGLRGVFEGPSGTAVVAYCAPDVLGDGADGGEGEGESVERRLLLAEHATTTAADLRERCANSFYRGALASEVYSRTVSGLKLLKVACRICGTEQMRSKAGCV